MTRNQNPEPDKGSGFFYAGNWAGEMSSIHNFTGIPGIGTLFSQHTLQKPKSPVA
jgi:hypothetical protein